MKFRRFSAFFLALLLAVLCCFSALLLLPEVSAQAARDAMLLCAQTLIPSLFPFFVLGA